MVEMFVDKIPTKSNVFSFMTNNKTYIMACPLSNNALVCGSTVSQVLELPANEEDIAPAKVKEWFALQQEIKSELPLFTGVMMSSTNYMFIDEQLTITNKARFIFDYNYQVGSGYKKFKFQDKEYKGSYKGSILYSQKLDKKHNFISRSGDFTLRFDKKVGTASFVMKNRTMDVIPFNSDIMKENSSKKITEQHVIWKVAEWGNQSLWVSLFSNKMWLFEENPLY